MLSRRCLIGGTASAYGRTFPDPAFEGSLQHWVVGVWQVVPHPLKEEFSRAGNPSEFTVLGRRHLAASPNELSLISVVPSCIRFKAFTSLFADTSEPLEIVQHPPKEEFSLARRLLNLG